MSLPKRTRACGECAGCVAKECQICVFCLDSPKYGGEGKMKQKCKSRVCSVMKQAKMAKLAQKKELKRKDKLKNKMSELDKYQLDRDSKEIKHDGMEVERFVYDENDTTCIKCLQYFDEDESYEEHIILDHEHQCHLSNSCHLTFVRKSDLELHLSTKHQLDTLGIESNHTEEKMNIDIENNFLGVTDLEVEEDISVEKYLISDVNMEDNREAMKLCSLCEAKFFDMMELKKHKRRHDLVRRDMTRKDTPRINRVSQRSQNNIDMTYGAEEWVKSQTAVEHMIGVMQGVIPSLRHELFMDRRERCRASATDLSRLHRISNPGLLKENNEISVIRWIQTVFQDNLYRVESRLRVVAGTDSQAGYVYVVCVLLPETFIHRNMVLGNSWKKAQEIFMEMVEDRGEMEALKQEIKENAAKHKMEQLDESEDSWVDHSDIEDDA